MISVNKEFYYEYDMKRDDSIRASCAVPAWTVVRYLLMDIHSPCFGTSTNIIQLTDAVPPFNIH